MKKQNPWVRTVTVSRDDLRDGDWGSRERNPIALAMRRVLKPDVTLMVDVGRREYFLVWMTHRDVGLLPETVLAYANRVVEEECDQELTFERTFPSWSLLPCGGTRAASRQSTSGDK